MSINSNSNSNNDNEGEEYMMGESTKSIRKITKKIKKKKVVKKQKVKMKNLQDK